MSSNRKLLPGARWLWIVQGLSLLLCGYLFACVLLSPPRTVRTRTVDTTVHPWVVLSERYDRTEFHVRFTPCFPPDWREFPGAGSGPDKAWHTAVSRVSLPATALLLLAIAATTAAIIVTPQILRKRFLPAHGFEVMGSDPPVAA
jgi:hypothetical protein